MLKKQIYPQVNTSQYPQVIYLKVDLSKMKL
nr:MAG TPA: hypothetical protein [Caudoviricetes sp.]